MFLVDTGLGHLMYSHNKANTKLGCHFSKVSKGSTGISVPLKKHLKKTFFLRPTCVPLSELLVLRTAEHLDFCNVD